MKIILINVTKIKKQYSQFFFCLHKTGLLNKIQVAFNLTKSKKLLQVLIILNLLIL